MTIFDVEELPTHGGSLRIYARHAEDDSRPVTERVRALRPARRQRAIASSRRTRRSTSRCSETKRKLLEFLIDAKRAASDRRLRRAGQRQHAAELLRHPHRFPRLHGRPQPLQAGQVPARHAHPDLRSRAHRRAQPDYMLILPWNFKDEIMAQLAYIAGMGGAVHRPHSRAHPDLTRPLSVSIRRPILPRSLPYRSSVDFVRNSNMYDLPHGTCRSKARHRGADPA